MRAFVGMCLLVCCVQLLVSLLVLGRRSRCAIGSGVGRRLPLQLHRFGARPHPPPTPSTPVTCTHATFCWMPRAAGPLVT